MFVCLLSWFIFFTGDKAFILTSSSGSSSCCTLQCAYAIHLKSRQAVSSVGGGLMQDFCFLGLQHCVFYRIVDATDVQIFVV